MPLALFGRRGTAALTDAELVATARAGREEAYRELVHRFERPVYTLIARMVGDPATAEDLAQEVFVKAFRRLDSYDPERKLSSWLFKIAHNATIDFLRKGEPETVPLEAGDDEGGGLAAVLSDAAAESPNARAERRELARALESAIAGLRPEYRELVIMFYCQGISYPEMCEITGLPVGTVKTNLHRARKALAERMGALGYSPASSKAGETPSAGVS
jgi:RNA polymerase sigma-70 factor (ECF subfamily)